MLKNSVLYLICIVIFFSFACKNKNGKPPEGMVLVPAGEFLMGTKNLGKEAKKGDMYFDRAPFYKAEYPQRKVFVESFYIDKFEVTNERYGNIDLGFKVDKKLSKHPVVDLNWTEANRFCRWEKKRLPKEKEWEKAARGVDGRIYPWGNEFNENRLNDGKFSMGTTPVGVFDNGVSPYGVFDMAGNVWEWTDDWFKPYPGNDFKSDRFGENFKVIRGGGRVSKGHYKMPEFFRTSHRLGVPLLNRAADTGFRCVKSS